MTKWKKNSNYKFLHSPIALVILFCLFLFLGYKILGLIKENKETVYKKELILDQIDSLEKRKSSLTSNLLKIETEEGKEKIIRDKYQVAKDGEKMVTIVDNNDTVQKEQKKVEHGFWNWIKKTFKF